MSVVGRKHTGSGQGQPTDPDYRNAVEKLKSGEDLVWSAEPRVAAAALNEALNAVRAERDRLREAARVVMDDAYQSKCHYEAVCQILSGTQEQLRALRFAQLSGRIPISEFFARFEKVVDGMAP
jgi:hypothetical protein